MSWRDDMRLRDLDDDAVMEAHCIRCRHFWTQSAMELAIKVAHRDVTLQQVADNLPCPKRDCRHVGVRLELIRNEHSSSFVGGMP